MFHNHRASAIDLREPPAGLTEEVVIGEDESFVIHPGEFCLGRTLEWVELPGRHRGANRGQEQHRAARADRPRHRRLLRPGWKGTLTLELNNLTRIPIKLYPGLPIAQLSFMTLDRPALRPYGSPELGQPLSGPTRRHREPL